MRQKTIFIIPGYKHKPTNKAYKTMAKLLRNAGYYPVLVPISWKGSTISENTKTFLKRYKQSDAKRKYILGFSFGAMIAFVAASKVRTSGLILCSLSPYFKEDVTQRKIIKRDISVTKRRYQDFAKLHAGTLAKEIKTNQVRMLIGENEEKILINRVKRTYTKIPAKDKLMLTIGEATHDINNIRYLQTIHAVAKDLN